MEDKELEEVYEHKYQTTEEIKSAIEAILFSMGNSVEASDIAETLEISTKMVKTFCHELMEEYKENNRGLCIIELEDSFQMCSNPKYYDALIKLCHVPKKHTLTDVILETLAIIAYKQPVTRQEIEAIRGVKSDFAVNKLLEYNLITELGRKDVPGRPILFGTSEDFLRCFGVSSMDELPVISEEKKEEFRLEILSDTKVKEEIILNNL